MRLEFDFMAHKNIGLGVGICWDKKLLPHKRLVSLGIDFLCCTVFITLGKK